jgi:hypothetical protein
MLRDGADLLSYSDVHLIARLHLGLLDGPPVACRSCSITDAERVLVAAFNWPETPREFWRIDYAGRVYSIRPEVDYVRLCGKCHRRMDSWRTAVQLLGPKSAPAR